MLPTLRIWRNHFEYHSRHPRRLPTGIADELTREERVAIAASIATFQLGEHSTGGHLLRTAYRFAQRHDSPDVARIVELLIREEQQHAALLARFMAFHGIAARRRHWTDTAFRRLRRLGGLEFSLSILVTAELIGTVYYRALEKATQSQHLRLLCRVMVADELAHVGFESDLLLALRAARRTPVRAVLEQAQRALLFATALVVWRTHRNVLERSGHGMSRFVRACLSQHAFYLRPVIPSAIAGRVRPGCPPGNG